MNFGFWLLGLLFAAGFVFACSSSDASSPPGGASDAGREGAATEACGCHVLYNRISASIACGAEDCVGGMKFSCSAGAKSTLGAACITSVGDSGIVDASDGG
jgi:hypothetical protein